jgi:hypothetical protein
VFHVMSDLGTRHELFFERQKKWIFADKLFHRLGKKM